MKSEKDVTNFLECIQKIDPEHEDSYDSYISELTKFAMVLKTVLTMKRMNGHVQKNLQNALDQQKFAMVSKTVITMRMKRNVAGTVS